MISIKVLKSCQLLLPLLFISLSNIYVIIFMIVHSTTSCSFHLKILQFLIGIIFVQLCCELKSKEVSQSFKRVVTKKDNIQTHGGMSQASADGEQIRVVKWQKNLIFMLLMGQTMNTWIGFILTSEELYWLQSCQPVFTEIIITEPKL